MASRALNGPPDRRPRLFGATRVCGATWVWGSTWVCGTIGPVAVGEAPVLSGVPNWRDPTRRSGSPDRLTSHQMSRPVRATAHGNPQPERLSHHGPPKG